MNGEDVTETTFPIRYPIRHPICYLFKEVIQVGRGHWPYLLWRLLGEKVAQFRPRKAAQLLELGTKYILYMLNNMASRRLFLDTGCRR